MLREGQTPANRRAEEISRLDSSPSVSSRGSLESSQSFKVRAQHLISLSAAPPAPAHAETLCIFQENAPISAHGGRCAWRWVLAGGPAAPAPACPAPAAPDVFNHSPAACSFAVSVTPRSFRLPQHLSVGPEASQAGGCGAPLPASPWLPSATRQGRRPPCEGEANFGLPAICSHPATFLRDRAAAACAPEAAITKNTGRTERKSTKYLLLLPICMLDHRFL